jgi:ABC-type transport system involved in cytochrome c biogenesis permease subunit
MTMTLLELDPRLHLIAIVLYAVASGAGLLGAFLGKPLVSKVASGSAVLGLIAHLSAIGVRWVALGHGPFITKYENLSSYALATVLLALGASVIKTVRGRGIDVLLYPIALMLMAIGLYTGPEVATLPPTFSGTWLVLHVCFYFVAFAAAAACLSASGLVLLSPRTLGRLPSDPVWLDAIAYRFGGIAFAFWGIGMLTGSVWAYYSWGRFWGWDPVETWSLVTWLAFGIYLHARRFYRLSGKRAATLLIVCVVLAFWSLFGTSILTDSIHAVYFQ